MIQTRFSEMTELAYKRGVETFDSFPTSFLRGKYAMHRDEFLALSSEAHIFVFNPLEADEPMLLDESVPEDGIVLDLPFPVCYFEMG